MIDFFGELVHALGLGEKRPFSSTGLSSAFKKRGLHQGPTGSREDGERGGND